MLTIFHKLSNLRANITENINYIISGYACTGMTMMLHRFSLQCHKQFLDETMFLNVCKNHFQIVVVLVLNILHNLQTFMMNDTDSSFLFFYYKYIIYTVLERKLSMSLSWVIFFK